MQCSRCQHENPVGAKFCNACATPLALPCPACAAENPPGAKFCNQCATPLAGQGVPQSTSQVGQPPQVESPPNEPSIPDAERRQLTVMFCDLADSTRLSGQLDPEDLRDVIRAYQSASAEVVERYDGYIAQHLGDGLMVYFGWPQAHEDDAQRAVYAGLGILAAMGGLNTRLEQEKGVRLTVRLGIHTGLVVVGEIGQGASQEHLALGETPNIASRIEGVAELDTVAISGATYQLVQGYFVCEALGQQVLKGVEDLQQVYRVVGTSSARSRLDIGVARGLTPLVGRESETALLFERWQQVKDGQGQVVLLRGEAGIGKSRLIQVLREHVADELHTRLECRSSPYYQNTALYPISGLLERTLQFERQDAPDVKLEKLEQMLRQYRLPVEDWVPVLAPLLSIPIPEGRYPPLSLSPQRQRQKTLEAIMMLLLQQAEQQPVLFILEDLHWTDPSTLGLLGLLIDQVPTVPICVLLTCRPEFQPPWELRTHLSSIALSRLNRTEIARMAEQIAGDKHLPEPILEQIADKTDGIPLFVEEMTKAVLESGALKDVDGHYELVGSISALATPATLQDSLMARLDRLVTAKAVAQYAAVIGRQFSYDILHAVSQLNERTLQDELQRLVEAELLYQRGLPPQATYTFKHALIQDAAYQSLLKTTRQQYHRQIAWVMEDRSPETAEAQPELLAHHHTEAGQNETAISYWQRAGQRAIQRSAHVEAVAHLTQGLSLLMKLPETPVRLQQELDLQIALGSALYVTKGTGTQDLERAYGRARELCQQIGDTSQLFPALRGLVLYYQGRGQLQTAYRLAEQLLGLAQSEPEPAHLLLAHNELGRLSMQRGEPAAARSHYIQALEIYNPQVHRDLALRYGVDFGVASGSQLAMALWQLGYPDQALRQSKATCILAQEVPHPYSLVAALVVAARLSQFRHEALAVQEQAASAVSLATEQGFALFLSQGTVLHGWALAMQGQGQAGIAEIRQGLAAYLTPGAKLLQPYFLGLLAEAYGEGGNPEEGLHALDEALLLMETTEARFYFYAAELYRLKGALLLRQAVPEASQAEACFHQALDIARSQQAKSWELRAATSLAHLWQQQGNRKDAYDLLVSVYGWFTEGFDTADLKDAKSLLQVLEG